MDIIQHPVVCPRQHRLAGQMPPQHLTPTAPIQRRKPTDNPTPTQHLRLSRQQHGSTLRWRHRLRTLRDEMRHLSVHRSRRAKHYPHSRQRRIQLRHHIDVRAAIGVDTPAMRCLAAIHHLRHQPGTGLHQYRPVCSVTHHIGSGQEIQRQHAHPLRPQTRSQCSAEHPGAYYPTGRGSLSYGRCLHISSASSRSPGSVIFRFVPTRTSCVATPMASIALTSSVTTRPCSATHR